MLIVARIAQGAGGGALQPIAQAVLMESFPAEKRGSAMAVFGLGVVVAPIIGPTLGGWITDNYSWRWIFYINIPIGMLAVFMSNMFIEDPPYIKDQRPGRIDYIGFGLMAVALGAMQLVLDKGQEDEWFASSFIVWFAILSATTAIAFIIWELRSKEPIVDLRVLANRNFAVGTTLMIAMAVVLYGTIALHQARAFHRTAGVDIGEVDIAAVARGYGAEAWSVSAYDELVDALTEARASGRPAVVDCLVDPDVLSPSDRLSDYVEVGPPQRRR